MSNDLRATWNPKFETTEELLKTKELLENKTKGISDEVIIIPLTRCKELLVSVWITANTEYWENVLNDICGEKVDYTETMGYEE